MTRLSPRRRAAAALVAAALWSAAAALAAESFTFSADKVESSLAKGKERTVLSGRARVTSGSLSIQADRVEISGKDFDLLECTGSVRAVDSEKGFRIETPRLRYERSRKYSLMQGPSVLEDSKNRLVLKAMWIEDDGEKDLTLAQVNVRILKAGLACRSEYALFRRGDKVLELTGSPRVVKDGDEFGATRIVVNTETEEIRLEGAVTGSVASRAEKSSQPAAPQTSPQTAPAAASPTAPASPPPGGDASPPAVPAPKAAP